MRAERAEHRRRPEQPRRQQPDEDVDAEMRADLDPVGHAEQDQPGEQDAGEFERPGPAGVEHVAGDHLGEGDQRHRRQQGRDEVLLQPVDQPADTPHPVPLGIAASGRLPRARSIGVRPTGAAPARADAPMPQFGWSLAATAASIRSCPMSSVNFAQTGFIAATHAARCSGVSSRISSPVSAIRWRFVASIVGDIGIGLRGHLVDDLQELRRAPPDRASRGTPAR